MTDIKQKKEEAFKKFITTHKTPTSANITEDSREYSLWFEIFCEGWDKGLASAPKEKPSVKSPAKK